MAGIDEMPNSLPAELWEKLLTGDEGCGRAYAAALVISRA